MEQIIIYGSQYGSTYRYVKELSEQTHFSAVNYKDSPDLSNMKTIIYLGGMYAGGVLGLAKILRNFFLQNGQNLLLVTVGLADPNEPENKENIRTSLQRQLSPKLLGQAKIFHLRGGIDYQNLSFGHRMMMKLLYPCARRPWKNKWRKTGRSSWEVCCLGWIWLFLVPLCRWCLQLISPT